MLNLNTINYDESMRGVQSQPCIQTFTVTYTQLKPNFLITFFPEWWLHNSLLQLIVLSF